MGNYQIINISLAMKILICDFFNKLGTVIRIPVKRNVLPQCIIRRLKVNFTGCKLRLNFLWIYCLGNVPDIGVAVGVTNIVLYNVRLFNRLTEHHLVTRHF